MTPTAHPTPAPAPAPQITILGVLRAMVLATPSELQEMLILIGASFAGTPLPAPFAPPPVPPPLTMADVLAAVGQASPAQLQSLLAAICAAWPDGVPLPWPSESDQNPKPMETTP